MLESTGLRCELDGEGVACKGLTNENVQEVFKVLAMPTSMDFRLNHCKEQREDPTEQCEEECSEALNEFKLPDFGCDCSSWEEECVKECVDNYEYSEDQEDCQELEKKFFSDWA